MVESEKENSSITDTPEATVAADSVDKIGPQEFNWATLAVSHVVLAAWLLLPLLVDLPSHLNIIVSATLTVASGSIRSVKPSSPAETMSTKDAVRFPLMGSVVLLSLFLAFKFLPKEMLNTVLTLYFILLGLFAFSATVSPVLYQCLFKPLVGPKANEEICFLTIPAMKPILSEELKLEFSLVYIAGVVTGLPICVWYYKSKHFLANNILGVIFSIQGIELLSLGSVQVGTILLVGLFFYDIFWVFFTPVMVAVAKNFDVPIKLLFPRVSGEDKPFSMLGLGDIVIPGLFVALMLRFDRSKRGLGVAPIYFITNLVSYVIGLLTTVIVMDVFQAAQPALLYIVPAVLLGSYGTAFVKGELKDIFTYREESPDPATSLSEKKDQ